MVKENDAKVFFRLIGWGIETGFREVKYILGMEAFHSKKSNSIIQEIYARMIMYNYSMLITKEIKTKEKN